MKKLLCLFICFCVCGELFAIGPHYTNHTQNISGNSTNSDGLGAINVVANIGDSVTMWVTEQWANPTGPWFFNGDTIPNATGYIIHLIITQSGTYSIWGDDFPILYRFFICLPATAIPLKPIPIIVNGTKNACPGDINRYSVADFANPSPCVTSYTWIPPAGALIYGANGGIEVRIQFTSSFVGDTLRVTANNALGSSGQRKLMIKLNNLPKPDSITGPATVCSGSIGNLYSIPYELFYDNGTTFTWTGPSGSHIRVGSTTSSNNILTTTSRTVYVNYGQVMASSKLKVKANNLCGSGLNKTLQLTPCGPRSGIISEEEEVEIELYPNPFTDNLTITLTKNQSIEINLYDITSRKVFNQRITSTTSLNTSHLAKGIYIYEVRDARGVIKKGKVFRV